jgi:hypothetical protein
MGGPGWVGPVGLEPTTRGLKGRRIAATVASTCDYVLTASPTSPTSRLWSTSFHATNHATRSRSAGFVPAGRVASRDVVFEFSAGRRGVVM